jgi:translation initiation factor IF-1
LTKPRIGIYGSAPKDTVVFDVITSILGYDPFDVKEVEQDPVIAKVCGRGRLLMFVMTTANVL